ncbi:MAG: response regulator transcription factor [Oscillospiraceae bacterium]|nr:response regulator transcription factor [Oscillospiraceae bacterium]
MIDTVIVDDSLTIQRYLEDMLASDGRFRITAKYRDAFDAEAFIISSGADLVLMDVQTLHNHSGLSIGGRIRQSGSGAKIVAVTSLIDPEVLEKARSGGADSLWYKDHGSAELMEVIDRTLAGEHVFPDSAPSVELKEMFSGELTPRQMDVLRCYVKGMTYDEIAEKLFLSKSGVRKVIERIMERGGFENKFELFIAVVENKLVVTSLLDKEDE